MVELTSLGWHPPMQPLPAEKEVTPSMEPRLSSSLSAHHAPLLPNLEALCHLPSFRGPVSPLFMVPPGSLWAVEYVNPHFRT